MHVHTPTVGHTNSVDADVDAGVEITDAMGSGAGDGEVLVCSDSCFTVLVTDTDS